MYRFAPSESSAQAARRLLTSELDAALEWLGGRDRALDLRVHEARKHLKRVRALLDLGRFVIAPEALREQARAAQAAAATLSALRGRAALLICFDALLERTPDLLDADAVQRVRATLSPEAEATIDSEAPLTEARGILMRARADAHELELSTELNGWEAWSPGFQGTYREARRAHLHASNYPTARHLHAFRTAEKRHLYQVELLEPIWEGPLRSLRQELSELGDLLGDHHDLSLLWRELERSAELEAERAALRAPVEQRLERFGRAALTLGGRAFAEKPGAIARRFGEYFRSAFD